MPLLAAKYYAAPAVFEPANLLREARRQRGLADFAVPAVGLLDPDGDIVRYLAASGCGRRHPGWACYHTEMWTVNLDGIEIGVVGMAVGAPFAVLVAEQLAASGAELVLSITSAGQISAVDELPCFVLIEKALRDEGTSLHYQPPGRWSRLDDALLRRLAGAFDHLPEPVWPGSSWTTDAPYRETACAIEAAKQVNIACVEMEAAGLYAYAAARGQAVVCFAHITNGHRRCGLRKRRRQRRTRRSCCRSRRRCCSPMNIAGRGLRGDERYSRPSLPHEGRREHTNAVKGAQR
jgi:uridine phosphorylase